MNAHSPEVTGAFEDLMRAFDEYKATNDGRLETIERRLTPDVLVEDKLARLDETLDLARRRLDDIALKAARPALGRGERPLSGPAAEHKAAFDLYVRSGEATGLKRLEEKALSVGSAPDGGYLVPPETETEVTRRLSLAYP